MSLLDPATLFVILTHAAGLSLLTEDFSTMSAAFLSSLAVSHALSSDGISSVRT